MHFLRVLLTACVLLSSISAPALAEASHDASLASLSVSGGVLYPSFSPDLLAYTCVVHYTTRSVTLTTETAALGSSAKVNGVIVANGNPSRPISLGQGETPVSIIVTAPDQKATRAYSILIKRGASANSELSALSLSGVQLQPAFSRAVNQYSAAVASTVSAVSLSVVSFEPSSTIKVNGADVKSQAAVTIALSPGPNPVDVVVTSQDRANSTTYALVITRARSQNAALSSLSIAGATLVPEFDPERLLYSTTVSTGTQEIAVCASPQERDASVRVNGTTTGSSVLSQPVALVSGVNKLLVLVLAPDALTTRTYTISVLRPLLGESADTVSGESVVTVDKDTGARLKFITVGPKNLDESAARGKEPLALRLSGTEPSILVQFDGESFDAMRSGGAGISVATPTARLEINPRVVDREDVQVLLRIPLPEPTPKVIPDRELRFNVGVKDPAASVHAGFAEAASRLNASVVGRPTSFLVQAIAGDRVREVYSFTGDVDHYILTGLPEASGVAGVVLSGGGTFSPVPVSVRLVSGQQVARFRAPLNETYAVVKFAPSFTDIDGHWARAEIMDLASRMVIPPTLNATSFGPDAFITRGEFVTLVARALGLVRSGSGKDVFKDVPAGDPSYDGVFAAYKAGIALGRDGSAFGAGARITREEAFTLIYRAMGGKDAKAETSFAALGQFRDAVELSSWARDAAAHCVKTGIVNGSDGYLTPRSNVTKAQTAVIIRRMLEAMDLI